jgi:major capsid protein gp7
MATLSTSVLTLTDHAKRVDSSGRIATIAELLAQQNDVLTDMLWKAGNMETGEKVTVRTGLPAAAWRLLNQGVAATKSSTAQIVEQCGILEARGQVDCDIANLSSDLAGFRLSEATPHMESMNIELTQTLFYGNSGLDPEEFTGLSPRYSALSGAGNSSNVINGGGVGSDNSSIWLIGWGEQTVYGIYPKNSMAGLQHKDLGEADAFDANGLRFRAYLDWWQWKAGLALKDWRYAVRICNIDISNLVAQSAAADLIELMIKAVHRIPTFSLCKPVFYINRTCFQMLDIARRADVIAGGGLTYESVDGKILHSFRGIPVRRVDALLETEAAVT